MIDDIPDVDEGVSQGMSGLSLGGSSAGKGFEEIPDMDDIPDMEEEGLEDEDDEATAAPKTSAPAVIQPKCVIASRKVCGN